MYDPRVGRWFAPDLKSVLQPNWSTYKAFFDNPNIFIDPDGKTEWQVTTVINHKTGKTEMIFEVINADKLDIKIINVRDYYYKDWDYQYSDIIHSSTINIYKDGTQTVENHKTEYAERYTRDADWDFIPEIPSIDFGGDSDIKIKDGYVFTTEWGKNGISTPNKSSDKSAKDTDMTALMAITNIIRGGKLPKGLDAVNKILGNTSKIVQDIFKKNGIVGKVNLKEGRIDIKYETEDKYYVNYRAVDGTVNIVPHNAPTANYKKKDTLVYEHDIEKVTNSKEEKFQKDKKQVEDAYSNKKPKR
jgi:hypothetical protein